ncbi:FecR domain-containing protein [Pseudomonas fluorescens]|uniref:FecR family protein n=1 Tax=Pseudomonas fluorescens group TaxID=136843 RepID=UPI001783DF74|nr:FecR domain-containing protein [Pseudomonas fluorescens]MBD8146792.1 FecR domain-containing protein [Pseudomonas fluorescens]MBD8175236.1 FecR domain-containing protein [Pseudomonas fluorescens]MBD8743692.1 FecR domain-containing protein [Pseudomonas fluorescens]MBD8749967.1 FecR domain-containing protein [Pseudomonas fluorescens]MBD8759508.1 FecR domain-containing protein [Pseudomonas fluorescens]
MNRLSDLDVPDNKASDAIDAQAASWFARNRNDADRVDRKAFAAWRANPAHARAYAEFEQLWTDLAQLQPLNKPLALPRRKPVWRPALAIAAALLCAVLAPHLGAPRELYHAQVAGHAKGMRTLHLPDGSTLYVNANTRIHVDFTAHQRILHLDKGQLYIEVAADQERPLYVQAGEANVRVVGTGFDVRRSERQLVVSVAHGQVAFEPDAKRPVILLQARQRAIYQYAKGTLQQQTLNGEDVADWRSGHLAFRNRELASLIDELSLYRPQAPVQVNKAVAQLKVSGNLDVNDPDALLNALPALLPVKTVTSADGIVRIESSR